MQVVSAKTVVSRTRPDGTLIRIAECTVGDDTGVITLTARNAQVEFMKEGNSVVLRNAKIDMYKGSMRLAVDKWGIIEAAKEPADFTPKVERPHHGHLHRRQPASVPETLPAAGGTKSVSVLLRLPHVAR